MVIASHQTLNLTVQLENMIYCCYNELVSYNFIMVVVL